LMVCALNAVAMIVIVTNLVLVWPIMNSAFTQRPQKVSRSPIFTHVIDDGSKTYENYLANRGSLVTNWLSAYHPSRGLVAAHESVLMEYVLNGKSQIIHRYYTPNKITYEINGQQPGEMVISMGYDPGWHTTDGRRLWQEQNLITFGFRGGPQKVILEYRPPYFFAGLALSIVSVLAFIAVWRCRRVKRATATGYLDSG